MCLIFFVTSLNAQWANGVGSSGNDWTTGIAYDASGNVYITGYFSGTVDFDPGAGTSNLTSSGSDDIFIAKYNSSGVFQWANRIGGPNSDKASAIKVDGSNNVFIVGYFIGTVDFDPSGSTVNLSSSNLTIGDGFFAKYSSSGTYLMAKNFGGNGLEEPKALALSGGNIYLTGVYRSTADFDPDAGTTELTCAGSTDIFIAAYSSTGTFIFAKGIGSTGADVGNGIGIDGNIGQIFITGSYSVTVDFDPSGSTANLTSNGVSDIFIAAYDNSGIYQWAKSYGGTASDEGTGIAVDENNGGDIYVIGNYQGTIDFNPGAGINNLTSTGSFNDIFFAKYDGTGGYYFAKSVGSEATDDGQSITFDASSNIYITGSFNGLSTDFDPGAGTTSFSCLGVSDLVFAKYNSSGAMQWAKSAGSTGGESANCVVVDGTGNVYVGGYFSSTVDFDPDAGTNNLVSSGAFDLFFAKYTSSGALPVELTNFSVCARGRLIELNWKTATELNNYGFEIQRSRSQKSEVRNQNTTEAWNAVGFVEGHGTTNTPKEYSFADNNIPSGNWSYRLKQIDRNGQFEYSKKVEIAISDAPTEFALAQNYPNPFNPTTVISYQIPVNSHVSLKIYDAIGREAATLVNETKDVGHYSATLDASKLSSGIYFAKLQSGEKVQLKKMVLLK